MSSTNRDFWCIVTFLIIAPYKYSHLLTDEFLVDKYLWQIYGEHVQTTCGAN